MLDIWAPNGAVRRREAGDEQARCRRRLIAGRAQHGEAGQVLGRHGDEIERDADTEHGGNIEARRDEFEAGRATIARRPAGKPAQEAEDDPAISAAMTPRKGLINRATRKTASRGNTSSGDPASRRRRRRRSGRSRRPAWPKRSASECARSARRAAGRPPSASSARSEQEGADGGGHIEAADAAISAAPGVDQAQIIGMR
jgi:hypothetical protein